MLVSIINRMIFIAYHINIIEDEINSSDSISTRKKIIIGIILNRIVNITIESKEFRTEGHRGSNRW
jgi:hypothetical protein